MKNFKLSALPLAIAGVLVSGTAIAGTEACFEVYKVAPGAVVAAHGTLYSASGCVAEAGRVGATATDLQPTMTSKVAYELTKDVSLNLENLGAAAPRTHVVYIPTTDIPPASRITLKLDGGYWFGNANQLHLVAQNAGGQYVTVGSSDGAFDKTATVNGDTVTFLTKAGVTIGAGSRLVLSKTNPNGVAANGALLSAPSIKVMNSETCTIDSKVTISAIAANTDSGSSIVGGVSAKQALLDTAEQFQLVTAADPTNAVQVDAEDPSFRTKFVFEQAGGNWVGKVTETAAVWESKFVNQYNSLDAYVQLIDSDKVNVALKASGSAGEGVKFSQYSDVGITALDSAIADADHIAAAAHLVDVDGDDVVGLSTTAQNLSIDAYEVFGDGTQAGSNVAQDVFVAAKIENVPVGGSLKVMDFNYNVETKYSMIFGSGARTIIGATTSAALLNKSQCVVKTPFEVGVNGAVLKVPYTYETQDNWVRITNEHNTEAQIFLDIFDESSHEKKNVTVGTVAGKASVVLKADELIAAAKAAGYTGTGKRHTMTFTVTAPKDRVHGVSVQKIPGGLDRVLPVLDTNDWQQ